MCSRVAHRGAIGTSPMGDGEQLTAGLCKGQIAELIEDEEVEAA
jgi:hypothetical protein